MDVDVAGISYDPITGIFYNRASREIGSYSNRKYGRINIGTVQVSLSRLAIKIMTGKWPSDQVDHINGNTKDNRWENLRVCSRSQNQRNKPAYCNSKTRYKGVYSARYKQREYFLASIQCDGKRIFLGSFKTPELAAIAYDDSARIYHKEFANLNFK